MEPRQPVVRMPPGLAWMLEFDSAPKIPKPWTGALTDTEQNAYSDYRLLCLNSHQLSKICGSD